MSKDIKNLLITFFSELIDGENNADINRQVLSESTDFDAHQIFNYILSSNDNKKNITIKDIKNYLKTNNIEISEQDLKLMILFYDINSDGELSFNINFSLCKLFQKEIAVDKKIIKALIDLRNKRDFNLHEIYHTLKSDLFITEQSLKNFLSRNNIAFLDSDIKKLMKRLDLNKDGKVDFCEFHSLLYFDKCDYICLLNKRCLTCGNSYCNECFIEKHGCHLHNKKERNINKENKSPNIINNEEINNNTTNENKIEIKELNEYIKFLLKGENKIENIKINLSEISDFSVEDAFRIFEKNGRGYLDRDDIKYGLNALNIYPSEYNLDLFLKRYDLQKKGFISYEDFYDIVVPFEKEYRLNMQKRLPKSNCPQSDLGKEINNMLNCLFKFLIDFENKANIEKKSLNVNFKEVFNELDTEKQGFFTFENFLDYLNGYNLVEENINPDLLYIRLDKNRNGIIDLEEFAAEMTPL